MLGPDYPRSCRNNSLISPLFGSFEGFPSMYINVGTAEILKDDAKRVLKKAQDAGMNVTFEEDLHLVHTYQIRYPYFPEA
jgi:acetyl esterase/lipase